MGIFRKVFGRTPPPPADVYLSLRAQALAARPEALGLAPSREAPIYGVIMETGYPDAVATFVCMGEGSVSLYLSTGGGVLGAGEHEAVRSACFDMLAITNEYARDFIGACERADPTLPLPGPGQVFFFLLTPDGVYRGEGPELELVEQRHPFSALFNNCHEVMGQARMAEEALRGGAEA